MPKPRIVVAALAALTLAALWPLSRLQLSTDLTRLLPADAPTARAFSSVIEDFALAETVFVRIASPAASPAAENELVAAAWRLEERLATRPDLFAEVRSGIGERDEQLLFEEILPYAALLLDDDSWRQQIEVRTTDAALAERAALLRRQATTSGAEVFLMLARSDPLGLVEAVPALTAAPRGLPLEPLTGSFLAAGGEAALLLIEPAVDALDAAGARRFADALAAEIELLREEWLQRSAIELDVRAVGGPLYAAADERAVRGNLVLTLGTSVLVCGAILWLVFGSLRLPAVVVSVVLAGAVWTFALLALLGIEISAIGLGFAAVLVGLGVDYGVHCAGIQRQHLVAGAAPDLAWRRTRREIGPAIWTSALTTGGGFAVLLFADLRLLRDVGLVVSLGILAVATATWTLGGALLQLLAGDERQPLAWRALAGATRRVAESAARRPRLVLAASAVLLALLVPGVARITLGTDLQDLRPGGGSLYETERLLAEEFGIGSETAALVVTGEDADALLAAVHRAVAELRRTVPVGSEVTAPSELLLGPEALTRRLRELRELDLGAVAGRFEEALVAAGLDPRAFGAGLEGLRRLGRGEAPPALAAGGGAGGRVDLPGWLEGSVVLGPERYRALVQVRLAPGQWPDGPPPEVRVSVERAAPGAAWASFPQLAAELTRAARHDLELLGPLALVVVVAVVWWSFRRRVAPTALAVLPVAVASAMTLGGWGWSVQALDLIGLAVLPIVLGIGIDDGLHVVHRAGQGEGTAGGSGGLLAATVAAGRAMTVTTLTTCAGFASLLLSNIAAVRRAGAIVTVGVALALLATLMLLPAVATIAETARRSRRSLPVADPNAEP